VVEGWQHSFTAKNTEDAKEGKSFTAEDAKDAKDAKEDNSYKMRFPPLQGEG
jgi:hypothetical protein